VTAPIPEGDAAVTLPNPKGALSHLALVLVTLLGAASCGTAPTVSGLATDLPGNPGESPMLGMGYDPVLGKLTGLRCLQGVTPKLTHAKSAEVKVQKDLGYDQLERLLSGKLSVSVPVYPGINANGSASYASEYAKTDYSETFVISLEASAGGLELHLEDPAAAQLSPPVKRIQDLYTKPGMSAEEKAALTARYREMCGTEFVSAAQFGLSMVAVLKVEYATEYARKAFGGSIGVEVLGGIASGSLDIGVEHLKSAARARTSLMIQQRGGDPIELLRIVKKAGTSKSINDEGQEELNAGGFFLQCDFNNRQHCTAVFRAALDHAKGIEAAVEHDGSYQFKNAMPLVFKTTPYPIMGPLRDISVEGPRPIDAATLEAIAKDLQRYRKQAVEVKGQALADLNRIEDLREKLSIDMSGDFGTALAGQLAELEQKAKAAEKAANEAQSICDAAAGMVERDDTKPCGEKATAAVHAVQFDRSVLSVMPRRFYSWCILAHSDMIINMEDKLAAVALLERIGKSLLSVGETGASAEELSAHCLQAETTLKGLEAIDLDFDDSDPSRDVPVASLRIVASLDQVKTITARNQFLVVTEGLRELPNLVTLDLYGNHFSSLTGFRGWRSTKLEKLTLARNQVMAMFAAADRETAPVTFKEIDLSDNSVASVEGDLGPSLPALVRLDLRENPGLGDASWLATLPKLYAVDLRATGVTECPLPSAAACELDN
jgi:hypothetical protein